MIDLKNHFSKKQTKQVKGSASLFAGGRRNTVSNEDEAGRSTSRLRVVFALCVGVIQGLVDAPDTKKSVYLDKTRIQRLGGTLNFPGTRAKRKVGTGTQTPLPGFSNGAGIEQGVNQVVTVAGGVITRSFTAIETDAIWVRVSIQMSKQTSKGARGEVVQFRFSTKSGTDPFVVREDRTIRGAYYNPVEFAYELEVNNPGNTVSSFQVRLERVTPDVPSNEAAERTITVNWIAFTPVSYDKYAYPHTAVVGVQIPGYHFNAQPEVLFNVNTKRVLIPGNATIAADFGLNFTGNFTGALIYPAQTCNDPAWILLDLLTNQDVSEQLNITASQVNLFDLYACSVYNNQMVPTGAGGTERRYQISFHLEDFSDAKALIDNVCSAMHAKIYDYNGQIRIWQDRPDTVKKTISRADVAGGRCLYSGSTRVTDRATAVYCDWIDGANFGARTSANYEDQVRINRYGYRRTDIEILGLASQFRANRFCRWFLWTQWNQDRQMTCAVRPGIALGLLPGDLIAVSDEKFSLIRIGGIIVSATANSITLDSPLAVTAGMLSQELTVMLPDGTLEVRAIALAAGSYTVITVGAAFSQIPLPESTWAFKSAALVPSQWRLINKLDNPENPALTELQCVAHNPNKYTEIEYEVTLPTLPTRLKPPDVVTVPSFAAARYRFVQANGETRTILAVVWSPPILNGEVDPFTAGYLVQWSADNIEWQDARTMTVGQYFVEFDLPYDQSYYARVLSVDLMGRQSDWVNTGVATLGGNWHPDTIIYQTRLQAVTTISIADTDAIDVFVRLCYLNGLRDANNPDRSIIQECSPMAGNGLNTVKLWSNASLNPNVVFNGSFPAAAWSRALGLDPANPSLGTRYIDTRMSLAKFTSNDFHVAVFTTASTASSDANFIGASSGINEASLGLSFQLAVGSNGLKFNAYGNQNKTGLVGSILNASTATQLRGCILGTKLADNDARLFIQGIEVASSDKNVPLSNLAALATLRPFIFATAFGSADGLSQTPGNFQSTPISFWSFGYKLQPLQAAKYSEFITTLQKSLGRNNPSPVKVYADTGFTFSDRTLTYRSNLLLVGVDLPFRQLKAIDDFVKVINNIISPINPQFDCCPFAGNVFNTVKLFGLSGTTNFTPTNYNVNDWSQTLGIVPGTATNKIINLGITPNSWSDPTAHMCFYSTSPVNNTTNYDMFALTSGTVSMGIYYRDTNNQSFANAFANTPSILATGILSTTGLRLLNTQAGTATLYRCSGGGGNPVTLGSAAVGGTKTAVTANIQIGNTAAAAGSAKSIGFYSAGIGIANANIGTYTQAVKALMDALDRPEFTTFG